MTSGKQIEPVAFIPRLAAADEGANYWMRQAMVRLRREVCWIWAQEERAQTQHAPLERVCEVLDLNRLWEKKSQFFATDITARYLTEQLRAPSPAGSPRPEQGSCSWVIRELGLDNIAAFTLGLALLSAFDSGAGSVIALCHRDPSRGLPSVALVQRLWDEPEKVLSLGDPAHPLFHYGLLKQRSAGSLLDWESAFAVPAVVALQLLFPASPLPVSLSVVERNTFNGELPSPVRVLAHSLRSRSNALRVVPMREPPGTTSEETLSGIAEITGRPIYEFAETSAAQQEPSLGPLMTFCWLRHADLLLSVAATQHAGETSCTEALLSELQSLPITVLLRTADRALPKLSPRVLVATLESGQLSFAQRLSYWKQSLGEPGAHIASTIEECARRFRFGLRSIGQVCRTLRALPQPISQTDVFAACRSEVKVELGELAQAVTPRFEDEELILPPRQQQQFQEVLNAMSALTEVHYRWGTAKVWNEAGISVLFAGPPGTGKTMAAEVTALKLDLPMYRIDLSQVVDKYIGETEKHLKKIFDAADTSDMVIFIDEAEAILGRRMETRDAHDRYANLEISYLLDRMERFKGLAILATNRKKDLDEAFLRRLRYIIEFPLPGMAQRQKIWQQCIPPGVDRSELDIDFLSRQFVLAGGNIRSIVLNACLQSAHAGRRNGGGARLTMEQVLTAVKREYEKLGRSLTVAQCGPYTKALMELEGETGSVN